MFKTSLIAPKLMDSPFVLRVPFYKVDLQKDDDLVIFLQQAYLGAKQAVIINDIHRHWLPHALYPLISSLLFRNRLITHDGLVSIRRAFTRAEWELLLAKAGITNYKITWCFPFRWQVVLKHE